MLQNIITHIVSDKLDKEITKVYHFEKIIFSLGMDDKGMTILKQ